MGAAFIEYVERYQRDGATPGAGGLAATVVVTIPVDTLTGGNEPGTLDTGERISPDLARQYACESGIIPVVLNGQGMPLDVGREQRFHTKHQRIAIGLRDRTCTAEGCDWPPGMRPRPEERAKRASRRDVHHDDPWGRDGRTSVARGRLLCPHHHARAHDPAYETRPAPGGRVTFHRRT